LGHAGPVEYAPSTRAPSSALGGDDYTLKLWDVGVALASGQDTHGRARLECVSATSHRAHDLIVTGSEIAQIDSAVEPVPRPPADSMVKAKTSRTAYDPSRGLMRGTHGQVPARLLRLLKKPSWTEGHADWVTACPLDDGRLLATGQSRKT